RQPARPDLRRAAVRGRVTGRRGGQGTARPHRRRALGHRPARRRGSARTLAGQAGVGVGPRRPARAAGRAADPAAAGRRPAGHRRGTPTAAPAADRRDPAGGRRRTHAAVWVESCLAGGGLLLVHDDALLDLLDDWLADIAGDAFDDVLPLLPRAFGAVAGGGGGAAGG